MNGPPKLLIIEDQIIDARILTNTLISASRRLDLKRNGCNKELRFVHKQTLQEGLEACAKESFDLILTDLNLPDSDGPKTIQTLLAKVPDTPLIVLSGMVDDQIAIEAIAQGAQDCIAKTDISNFNMMMKIYHAIERQKLLNELRETKETERRHAEFRRRFLALMSHELRTPMNGVIGMTTLLLMAEDLTKSHREKIETIQQNGEVLLNIINDILDYTKIEAGKIEIQEKPLNIRELIENCFDTFRQTAQKKKIVLTDIISPQVPRCVVSDSNRLRQILLNLISNAIKFTTSGHVCVNVQWDGDPTAHKLRFAIKDTGVGIPPLKLQALFKPYAQVSDQDQFQGTGLGLSICRSLSHLMGGDIGVTSKEGRGSTFWFTIQCKSNIGQQEPFTERVNLGSKQIVVISNNTPRGKTILRKQLKLRGMEPHFLTSGSAAVIGSIARPPDLCIIDTCGTSDENAHDWLANITARWKSSHIPILLLTQDATFAPVDRHLTTIMPSPIKQSNLYQLAAQLVAHEPLVESPPANSQVRALLTAAHTGLRVLVVDDGEVNRMVAVQMLAVLGYQSDTACDGSEAIAKAHKKKYDIILMDCKMPGISGVEATKTIKGCSRENRATPIIALTANAFAEERDHYIREGMNDFLPKPINFTEIGQILKKWTAPSKTAATAGS